MSNRQLGLSSLYATAAFVIIVLGLQAASSILIPFIFAVFLSIIVWPFMRWLVYHRVPYGISIVIVILTIIGILVVL
ncbi:MAG: AI-2E family transporter, partial [Proteobacteria bacterium]|nr:AI-2E family transporter [Pseudomonadota bacterium]